MQQSSTTPKNQDVGRRLKKIFSNCLFVSTVCGTVSSLHPTSFLHLFHSFFPNQKTNSRLASLYKYKNH